ncbi:hypothetical protein BH10BAC4_BH10BAC4_21820 [soil metagenome]
MLLGTVAKCLEMPRFYPKETAILPANRLESRLAGLLAAKQKVYTVNTSIMD